MLMSDWDPNLYLRYARERTQPCIDLVNRIELDGEARFAADLGCGPGNSTRVLARRFPEAQIIGVDNSAAMIEQARRELPTIRFEQADAATWTADDPADVILSNATFQWLDHHETLLPHLVWQLRPGGVLAVQMPRNFQSPTHRTLRELASSEPFARKLSEREPYWVQPPGFYYDVLSPICSRLDIWETEYVHVLPDHNAIIEWYRSTGLRPYLQPLDEREQRQFLDLLHARLVNHYPTQKDGRVLFPFLRIFLLATR
jgi:trans-aconitate 2-methyltransferase